MKTPYNLSKDYEQLLQLICDGNEIACFVDYSYSKDDTNPCRDICKCRRHEECWIQFGVRGMQYGGVYKWQNDRGTEKELFFKECERMNVEFINPVLPEKRIIVIGCDKGEGPDFSSMVEIFKKEGGGIGILSAVPEQVKQEAIERLKEIPIPIVTPKEGLFFVDSKGKRTNHERQPSKYGKGRK